MYKFRVTNNAILCLVAVHMVYFTLSLIFGGIYTLDSPEYLNTATNLLHHGISYAGNIYDITNLDLFSLRPPGYGAFILLCMLISENHYFILIIQNILSIVTLFCIYNLLNAKKTSSIGLYSFWIGLIFFPVYFILVNMVMADALLGFSLILAVFTLNIYHMSHHCKYLLLFNLLLGISVMIKPVMVYFWIPNLLFSIYLYFKYFSWTIFLPALILPAVVGLWSFRNYQKTGYYHFSSIKMQNLLELNAGAIVRYKYGQNTMKSHRKHIRNESEQKQSYKEKSQFLLQSASDTIIHNLPTYSILHLKGMANFMLAPGRVDIETFLKLEPEKEISLLYEVEKKGLFYGLRYYFSNVELCMLLIVILIFFWNAISLFFICLSFFNDKLPLTVRIFIFLLIAYIVFVSGPGGYARFKTSIYPIMLLMVPLGVEKFKLKVVEYKKSHKSNMAFFL